MGVRRHSHNWTPTCPGNTWGRPWRSAGRLLPFARLLLPIAEKDACGQCLAHDASERGPISGRLFTPLPLVVALLQLLKREYLSGFLPGVRPIEEKGP